MLIGFTNIVVNLPQASSLKIPLSKKQSSLRMHKNTHGCKSNI